MPDRPVDPVHEAESLFVAAADRAGPALTELADELALTTIKEKHLQKKFRAALEQLAAQATPPATVSPSLAHGLKSEWPKLGNFDISLAWGELEVFGELKCGESDLTLSACGWDAAKCAFCLNHNVGVGMLLLAAAPVAMWITRGVGIELLSDGEWDMADIRKRYAAGFRVWEGDGYKPEYVYRRLRTFEVSRTKPFRIGRTPWLIGLSRVETVDSERMEWPPLRAVTQARQ